MESECFLLDVEARRRGGAWGVRLVVKRLDGKTSRVFAAFEPYFYVLPSGDFGAAADACGKCRVAVRGGEARVVRVEAVTRVFGGVPRRLLKVFADSPGGVPALRDELKRFGEVLEHDIPFTRRWLVDNGVVPCGKLAVTHSGGVVSSLKPLACGDVPLPGLRLLAFDIETYNPSGLPNPLKDPVLMVSWSAGGGSGVLAGKRIAKDFVESFPAEKGVIEAFGRLLREKRVDVLAGYNSDEFDVPYLLQRAAVLKAGFSLGRDSRKVVSRKVGLRNRARVSGRVHLDVFSAVSFLNTVGAFKLSRLTLGDVVKELLGWRKVEQKKLDIWRAWDEGGQALAHLADYSRDDAEACRELAEFLLPLELQLSRASGLTLFEASRATAGQMVEGLLLRKSFERGEVVFNKPSYAAVAEREGNPIQGAFVKVPEAGVYGDIMVFDFRSLYPSIITAYNIDPVALNCGCCKDVPPSPTGARFCRKRRGLIPEALDAVLDERVAVKTQLKGVAKGSAEHRLLDARQVALKIIANSFYGYLGYARSRFYSRECAESTTAWARHYIQGAIAAAEGEGFKVLYGDTDSLFLLLGSKSESDALAFRDRVNESLPGRMELELEDFYPRGVFVSKKNDTGGAKKKYALINREGKIKIRGFELVRRDWSEFARSAQREVLELLLRKGGVDEAERLVRLKVEELRSGNVPLERLAIRTQLRKNAKSYAIVSPELMAVMKARDAGVAVPEHAVIEYVVTRSGKSISDRAELLERARDYDADYYVNHQLLPAVLKILGAMGLDEDCFKNKGRQQGLAGFL
ncbi:MAG: DNA-directed DNA polymerase [Candidatus Micrarchaeota archaeon]